MLFPNELRPLIHELVYSIERTTRAYKSTFMHLPPPELDRGPSSFLRFMDLADRTAMQARAVLDEDSAARAPTCELRPPGHFFGTTLGQRIRARRAAMETAVPTPAAPVSTHRPSRGLH